MGNSASGARRKLGDAVQTRVFQRSLPRDLTAEEQAVINKLAEREQERMQHLPSMEEVNARNDGLGMNLNKLVASISGRAIDVTGGQTRQQGIGRPQQSSEPSQAETGAAGGATSTQLPRVVPGQMPGQRPGPGSRRSVAETDERFRLPSFLLRELLEKRNEVAASGKPYDIGDAAKSYGCDPEQLSLLLEHCCIPQVGKVGAFGHQYAFARAPIWWRGKASGQRFLSEPWEKMIKRDAEPMAPVSAPNAEVATPAPAATMATIVPAAAQPVSSSGTNQRSQSEPNRADQRPG